MEDHAVPVGHALQRLVQQWHGRRPTCPAWAYVAPKIEATIGNKRREVGTLAERQARSSAGSAWWRFLAAGEQPHRDERPDNTAGVLDGLGNLQASSAARFPRRTPQFGLALAEIGTGGHGGQADPAEALITTLASEDVIA